VTRDCADCDRPAGFEPRHIVGVINLPAGEAPPVPRHLSCCAAIGCAHCQHTISEAGGRTGQDLIDHLAAQRAARSLED
jgi:hypothetical protein